MSPLKMLPALSALCLASSLYALDEYMPVPFRVMEIDMGLERSSISGYYGPTYDNAEVEYVNNPSSIPVQGKFGLMDNLEGSMGIDYIINDSLGHSGLNRPQLALKYARPDKYAGGFLAVSLPVGFEEIMNAGNYATMTFGAMYARKFPLFSVLANAAYSFNTEDDNKTKMDNFRLFAKPEYSIPLQWLTRHQQYLGAFLGFTYDFYFNEMVRGESIEDNGMLLRLAPGLFYTVNKVVSLEVSAPLPIIGQNQPSMQTFRAQLHFTLDEGLYNTL